MKSVLVVRHVAHEGLGTIADALGRGGVGYSIVDAFAGPLPKFDPRAIGGLIGVPLASAGHDHLIKVWDATLTKELLTLKGHTSFVYGVAFSPDGKWIASASWDHTAKVWDAQIGKETITLKGHIDAVRSAIFSPDGKRIVTGGYDHTARVWYSDNTDLPESPKDDKH